MEPLYCSPTNITDNKEGKLKELEASEQYCLLGMTGTPVLRSSQNLGLPTQDQASQHFSMEWGGVHDLPTPAERLLGKRESAVLRGMVVEPLMTQYQESMGSTDGLCLIKIGKRGHEVGGNGEVRLDLARVKQTNRMNMINTGCIQLPMNK